MSQGSRALAGVVAPVVLQDRQDDDPAVRLHDRARLASHRRHFQRAVAERVGPGTAWALQVANFVLFGLALILFASGLNRGVAEGSKAGPALDADLLSVVR